MNRKRQRRSQIFSWWIHSTIVLKLLLDLLLLLRLYWMTLLWNTMVDWDCSLFREALSTQDPTTTTNLVVLSRYLVLEILKVVCARYNKARQLGAIKGNLLESNLAVSNWCWRNTRMSDKGLNRFLSLWGMAALVGPKYLELGLMSVLLWKVGPLIVTVDLIKHYLSWIYEWTTYPTFQTYDIWSWRSWFKCKTSITYSTRGDTSSSKVDVSSWRAAEFWNARVVLLMRWCCCMCPRCLMNDCVIPWESGSIWYPTCDHNWRVHLVLRKGWL